MPALPSCLALHACPPRLLPPPPSTGRPEGRRPLALLASKDLLSPAQLQPGSRLLLCFRESQGPGRGRGRGRPRTEVLPGWSGSCPQIRGPSRPSDSVGLGPGVQLGLIADCKPQTQEPSRRRNRIYRNVAPDAPPTAGKSSRVRNVPRAEGVASWSPPSSPQERAWLTSTGAYCAGDTEAAPPTCGDTPPTPAPHSLCTLVCAIPFTANVSLPSSFSCLLQVTSSRKPF